MSNSQATSVVQYNTTIPEIGLYFREGGKLFTQSIPTFLSASLLFWAVSIFSFSILMGPLIAGYMLIFVRRLRGEDVTAADIFKGFTRFVPIVIAFYLTKTLITIGLFLLIIPGLIFIAQYFFVELLILDKNLGVFEAMKLNKQMASERGTWNYVILNIVLLALLNIGGLLSFGIGYLLITPYVLAIYAVSYEDAFNKSSVR